MASHVREFPSPGAGVWVRNSPNFVDPTSLSFCCGGTAGYNTSLPLFIAVTPTSSDTQYDIAVYDASSRVPLEFFYDQVQAKLSCSSPGADFTCSSGVNCTSSTWVPPSSDTAVAYVASTSPTQLNASISPQDRLFSGAIVRSSAPTGVGAAGTTFFNYSLSSCDITFLNLFRGDGEPVEGFFQFREVIPTCENEQFRSVAKDLQSLARLLQSATSAADYLTYGAYISLYTLSDAWFGCQAMVDRDLVRSSSVVQTTTTSRCTLEEDDPARNSDPCCSHLVAFFSACVKHTVTYNTTNYQPVLNEITSQCRQSPGCIYLGLEDYTLIQERNEDTSLSCSAQVSKAFGDSISVDPDVFLYENEGVSIGATCRSDADCLKAGSHCTAMFRCSIPCLQDNECASGECRSGSCTVAVEKETQNALLIQYLSDNMAPFDRQFLRERWGLAGSSSNVDFLSQLTNNTLSDQCVGSLDFTTDEAELEVCLDTASCNWGICQRNADECEESCLNKPGEDGFCGLCSASNPEACIEVSEQEGCYTASYNLDYWGSCYEIGADHTDYLTHECSWTKETVPDETTCFDDVRCPYTRKQVGPYGAQSNVCDPFCWYPTQTSKEECEASCAELQDWSAVSCVWTGMQCHLLDVDYESCTVLAERFPDVEYWEGRVWKFGAFETQEACGGVCLSSPGASESACSSIEHCSVRRSFTESFQTAEECYEGACTDWELRHPDPLIDGVCVFPFGLEQTTGDPTCVSGTMKGQMGCIHYAITNEIACLGAVSGAFWSRPATSPDECASHGQGCYETRYTHARASEPWKMGAPGDYFLSPKSQSECASVGGEMRPFYTWESGSWGNDSSSTWTNFSWRAREWKVLNSGVAPQFSRGSITNQLILANNKFLAQSRQTYQYCRYNRVIDLLGKAACSCGTSDERCSAEENILVGVARACSYSSFELSAYPSGELSWTSTVLSPGCVDIEAYAVSASAFKRAKKQHFFSDIYVRTLEVEAEGYSIITNKNDVVVGQLVGDGLLVQLRDQQGDLSVLGQFVDGEIEVCLYTRKDIPQDSRYGTFDFAYRNEGGRLVVMGVKVQVELGDVARVCATLSPSTRTLPAYFPIKRVSSWADETFIDQQQVETVSMFYVAVGIYAVLFVINSFNVINACITLRFEIGSWKSAVEGGWIKIKVPQIMHFLIAIILADRILYFAMLPTGVLKSSPSIAYILLGELPTYLFLSLITLLVYFWCTLLYQINRAHEFTLRAIKLAFALANVLVYSLLFVLIIVFIILEETSDDSQATCSDSDFLSSASSDSKEARYVISLVYQSIVAAVALLIALGANIYGIRVVITLLRVSGMSKEFTKIRRQQTFKFSLLVVICTVALVCLVGFLIYATAEETVPAVAALVFLLITELMPLALMVLMVHGDSSSSPRRLRFWLFCLRRPLFDDKSTATTKDTSGTNSSSSATMSGTTMTSMTGDLSGWMSSDQPVEVA